MSFIKNKLIRKILPAYIKLRDMAWLHNRPSEPEQNRVYPGMQQNTPALFIGSSRSHHPAVSFEPILHNRSPRARFLHGADCCTILCLHPANGVAVVGCGEQWHLSKQDVNIKQRQSAHPDPETSIH